MGRAIGTFAFEEQDMKIVVIGGSGLGSKLRESAA
jgi:hypothetical protein